MFNRSFRSFANTFKKQANSSRSCFSTSSEPKKDHTKFGKFILYVVNNRQQLFNIIGIYFVLSMSVHNLRIKQAWDEKEKELTAMKEQFTKIESKLSSSEWAEEVVKQVKASATATETLQTQVKTAFDEAKITGYTDPVVPKSAKDTITTAFEQLVSSGNKKSEEGTNAGNATKMI